MRNIDNMHVPRVTASAFRSEQEKLPKTLLDLSFRTKKTLKPTLYTLDRLVNADMKQWLSTGAFTDLAIMHMHKSNVQREIRRRCRVQA